MAELGKGVDATKSFFKNHWMAAIVVVVAVLVVGLAYDHKNQGKATNFFAGLPLVGKLFA
jgi:uncharacterized membrane protein